jgi:predicted PhzF superfamily epimerase YddE/YHI9
MDFLSLSYFADYQDPVCGSVHCALAPYWGKKLGKQCMTASMVRSF